MENALYYTFSTIPQTLAGAIALLSGFVLYKLQSVNSEIETRSLTVQQKCIDVQNNGLWAMHIKEQYENIYENSLNYKPLEEENIRLFDLHRTRLGNLLKLKISLLSSLPGGSGYLICFQ